MKTFTFNGGLHPNDHKSETANCAVIRLAPPQTMVYPMQQHIGAPCTPIVEVGQRVYMGEKIGDSDAFVSAPIHSSVSGTVTHIEPRLHPNGRMVMSVVIENDFMDEYHPSVHEREDIDTLTREEKLAIIREAGVVGLGGATFPTHIKLNPPADKKIDTLIINGSECEPYLTSDYRLMLESPALIFNGIQMIKDILGVSKCVIGIENNKPEAISAMKNLTPAYPGTEIAVLKTKYPQGSEKHLIKAVTGREVPSGGLPADVGVVVNNIDSCIAVYNAIFRRKPVISRIVTVSGSGIKKPSNFRVRTGTPLSYVLEKAECDFEATKKVIMGGPMMGTAIYDTNVPAIKGTSALLAFTDKELDDNKTVNCVKCGKCVSACPMNLMPALLNSYIKIDDFEMLGKLNMMDCIECGICSYTCPSRQRITQNIKTAKIKLRQKQ